MQKSCPHGDNCFNPACNLPYKQQQLIYDYQNPIYGGYQPMDPNFKFYNYHHRPYNFPHPHHNFYPHHKNRNEKDKQPQQIEKFGQPKCKRRMWKQRHQTPPQFNFQHGYPRMHGHCWKNGKFRMKQHGYNNAEHKQQTSPEIFQKQPKKKDTIKYPNISESSDSDSSSQDEALKMKQNIVESQSQALQYLKQKGFTNQKTNRALLSHFQNNLPEVESCLTWCRKDQALKQMLARYQKNFIILEYLGYCKKLSHWKVLSTLEKNNNDLNATLQKLEKRVQNIERKQLVEQQVKDCRFFMLEQIPQGYQFLIDGFNVVRTNKHLKKLTKNEDPKMKLQGILRLKTLVQTLAQGYLVLDKKFLDDAAQKEILRKIDVNFQGEKRVEVVYADPELKADHKIVQILKNMPQEERKKVLLVTSDRLLIKECQQICGQDLSVMGGKNFIKKCKFRLPKGFRNKVLKGLKGQKKDKNSIWVQGTPQYLC